MVLPDGIVATDWPLVRAKCADMGMKFDRWQDGLGRCILAKRESGLYAAGVGGCWASIPRQVGKTYMVGAVAFALCLITPGTTVLWTAHRTRTAKEVFSSMQGMARKARIKPHILDVRRGSGEQAVLFVNGSRILFGARAEGFGRGFADVSVEVFDECQILDEGTLADMIPATNTAANPLVLYVGTPPDDPAGAGALFAEHRAEALSDEPDPDTLFVEISADPECDPTSWAPGYIDWHQVAKANPSWPARTPNEAVRRMLKHLGRASFRRDGLGIWDDDAVKSGGVIASSDWAGCLDTVSTIVSEPVLALDASPMLSSAAIVAAGLSSSGKVHVEVTGADGVLDVRPGTAWAVDLLASHPERPVWIAAGSAAEVLVADLEARGVTVNVMPKRDYAAACVSTASAIVRRELVHLPQKPLEAAVVAGAKRSADEGLWTWGRVKSSADISPLVAMTVAAAVVLEGTATYDVLDSIA